ncbi:hypothetical protein C7974DRAFT_209365 [Boeremia exigua]|uniref:uncharacterized protein n=1 Tax=Boeremia exigua TaxID=749465 RepID=UPI001E8E450E|nr:uncharacterized protein C7974DRAFT_209365 [Boeremia exigua]KAH6625892.1 hypothetical protein C7974DRAFT_209365 [Boeremia exigua]
MTFLSAASLVDDATRATVALKSKATGRYVGRFGKFGPHCWDVKESIRNLYDKHIRPAILQRLDGRIGSVSSQDSVSITVYMIGRRANSAVPTVLFVSENQGQRKEARKLIKGSGILGEHQGWKTAEAAKDPSWGGELEQLASGPNVSKIDCTESPTSLHQYYPGRDTDMEQLLRDVRMDNIDHTKSPSTQVFYDPSQPLRSRGLTLYVSHGSGLRIITANLLRANGKIYYQGPAHAFFEKIDGLSVHSVDSADDFEFDIDDETETIWADDDTVALSIPELDCQVSAAWSSDDSEDLDPVFPQDSDDDTSSQSSLETMDQDVTDPATTYEETSEVVFAHVSNFKTRAPAPEPYVPALESLLPFGVLSKWSTDKDWALIEVLVAAESEVSAYFASTSHDMSTMRIARPSSVGAAVESYTASGGRITGNIAATPSDLLVPRGRSFQEVFSVRLDGPLADGDCGSAVIDALTGELYGHIVAGCRASGFAYVMAASHTMPEIRRMLSSPTTVSTDVATNTSNSFDPTSLDLARGPGTGLITDAIDTAQWFNCISRDYGFTSANYVGFPTFSLMDTMAPDELLSPCAKAWLGYDSYDGGMLDPSRPPQLNTTFAYTQCGETELGEFGAWSTDYDIYDPFKVDRSSIGGRRNRSQEIEAWFDEVVAQAPCRITPGQNVEVLVIRWHDWKSNSHKQEVETIRALFDERFRLDVRCHIVQLPHSGDLQAKADAIIARHASRCEDTGTRMFVYHLGRQTDASDESVLRYSQGLGRRTSKLGDLPTFRRSSTIAGGDFVETFYQKQEHTPYSLQCDNNFTGLYRKGNHARHTRPNDQARQSRKVVQQTRHRFSDQSFTSSTGMCGYCQEGRERHRTSLHLVPHHNPAPDCLCDSEIHASSSPRPDNCSAAGTPNCPGHLSLRECHTRGHYCDSLEPGAGYQSPQICHHRYHRPADPAIGRSTSHHGMSTWYCCQCTRASDASTICDPGSHCTGMLWDCSDCGDGNRGLGSQ